MTMRGILLALWFAGTLAAQTFIQMSDPQFGMFTKNANFEHARRASQLDPVVALKLA